MAVIWEIIKYLFTIGLDLLIALVIIELSRLMVNIVCFIIVMHRSGKDVVYEEKEIIPNPGINLITLVIIINTTLRYHTDAGIIKTLFGG